MNIQYREPVRKKHVINMHRIERYGQGSVRPKVQVFYRYDLECGHSVERRKHPGQRVPEDILCKECQTQQVQSKPS